MSPLLIRKLSFTQQYIFSVLLILAVSSACFVFLEYTGYHTAALLLLVTVSFIAMFCDIYPVILASILSALIWNYFFIPPRFTFHIGKSEDILMFLMYFIIALLNAVLTIKIRQIEKREQEREERENLIKIYNTLLSSLSHELRTPIAAIIGATDNLQTNPQKLSEQNKSELVSEISKASLRLNRDVENLLNMSRLESGMLKLNSDWCDINELVYEVLNRMKDSSVNHHFNVQIPEHLPYFHIDFGLMEQVIINLLQNALTYSPLESTITISANCIIDQFVLTIEDEGPGFPEDQIEKVFDRFYRLKNAKTGGTGLGLSIVKGFIEAHGGRVTLKNKPEGGAMFTIIIPAKTSYVNNLKNE